jgi:NADH:ubiquinone oxidoreductase subunit 4 (subunit M)
VYGLTSLVVYAAAKLFPRQGRAQLFPFLASFMAAVYLFILWALSPLCALEVFFAVSLVPVFYILGMSGRSDAFSAADSFFSSFSEALSLGVLILAFALIREPLGFASLSLPGGAQGGVMLFSFNTESFLPIQLIASSSGALLLLGYFWGLYKFRNRVQKEDKNAK